MFVLASSMSVGAIRPLSFVLCRCLFAAQNTGPLGQETVSLLSGPRIWARRQDRAHPKRQQKYTSTLQGVSNELPHTTYMLPLGTPWRVLVGTRTIVLIY